MERELNTPYQPEIENERPQPNTGEAVVQNRLFKRTDYFIDNALDFQRGPQSRSGLQLAFWS